MGESSLNCPKCRKPMRLARITPALAHHPELHSYECLSCREVVTVEVEVSKSRE